MLHKKIFHRINLVNSILRSDTASVLRSDTASVLRSITAKDEKDEKDEPVKNFNFQILQDYKS